jgi:carboxyl-terminal processing protease
VFDALLLTGGDERSLARACVEGMLSATGRSGYYADLESSKPLIERHPARPGFMVGVDEGIPIVFDLMRGGPAESRLQKGDRIVSVEGRSTNGMTANEVDGLLRGPHGSVVTLNIKRGEAEPFDISLTRAIPYLDEPSVRVSDGIGIVRIAGFDINTARSVGSSLKRLGEVVSKGYIIDLRANRGGLFSTAIETADLFVQNGELGGTQDRIVGRDIWYARPGDITNGLPLIVLTDGNTGGGALIVASALRLHRKARLIGRTTAELQYIQSILRPSDRIALKMTTASLVLADRTSSGHPGITPDIEISFEDQQDATRDALARAIALLSSEHH